MTNNLKQLRKEKSLSQQKLCDEFRECGYSIDRTTYSKYETGSRSIPCDFLIAAAKYYGTSTDYILDLKQESF